LKSFFLGPQAENAEWLRFLTNGMLERWFEWRKGVFPVDGRAISLADQESVEFRTRRSRFEEHLWSLMRRFEGEIPKFSPRYIGHMFSETSLPALLGHFVALLHNPNNISGESSRVGVEIESEAIAALRAMIGYPDAEAAGASIGHFTSGGTVANFEAALRARNRVSSWLAAGAADPESDLSLFEAAHQGWTRFEGSVRRAGPAVRKYDFAGGNPWEVGQLISERYRQEFRGPVLLVPESKHYSWKKAVSLLGLGEEAFWPVALDAEGRLCVAALARRIDEAEQAQRPILMVVSVAGTTELGVLDPVDRVQDLLAGLARERGVHIWHHVDAAYGGFLCSLRGDESDVLGEAQRRSLDAIRLANSVTLDPHKLGYVPYACGAYIGRDIQDWTTRSFDGPYLQFDAARDKGQHTLEGSRSASGAAATWLTARAIGLDRDGYGRILGRTIHMKRALEERLRESELPVRLAPHTDSNILAFCVARKGESVEHANRMTAHLLETLSSGSAGRGFFVSQTRLSWSGYGDYLDQYIKTWNGRRDSDQLLLVRLCLMNPFFGSREMEADFPGELVERIARGLG